MDNDEGSDESQLSELPTDDQTPADTPTNNVPTGNQTDVQGDHFDKEDMLHAASCKPTGPQAQPTALVGAAEPAPARPAEAAEPMAPGGPRAAAPVAVATEASALACAPAPGVATVPAAGPRPGFGLSFAPGAVARLCAGEEVTFVSESGGVQVPRLAYKTALRLLQTNGKATINEVSDCVTGATEEVCSDAIAWAEAHVQSSAANLTAPTAPTGLAVPMGRPAPTGLAVPMALSATVLTVPNPQPTGRLAPALATTWRVPALPTPVPAGLPEGLPVGLPKGSPVPAGLPEGLPAGSPVPVGFSEGLRTPTAKAGLRTPTRPKASAGKSCPRRVRPTSLRCWRRSAGGRARQVLKRHPADSQVRLDMACLRRWLQTPEKLHDTALVWLGEQANVVEDARIYTRTKYIYM